MLGFQRLPAHADLPSDLATLDNKEMSNVAVSRWLMESLAHCCKDFAFCSGLLGKVQVDSEHKRYVSYILNLPLFSLIITGYLRCALLQ